MDIEEKKEKKENIEKNLTPKAEPSENNILENDTNITTKKSNKRNSTKNNSVNKNQKNSNKKTQTQNNSSKNGESKKSNNNINEKSKKSQRNNLENVATENQIENIKLEEKISEEIINTEIKTDNEQALNPENNPQNNSEKTSENDIDTALEKRDINKEKEAIKKEIEEPKEETTKKEEQNAKNIETFEPVADNKKSNKKPVFKIIIISILILFIILISAFSIFTYTSNNPSAMAKGIYINGIDVSEMSKDDAKAKVEEFFNEKLSHDISLNYGEYETFIKPNEISLQYDINSAVNNAFKIGKQGNIFEDNFEILTTMLNGVNIDATYTYSKDTLKTILDNFSKELPDHVVENSYYIEDNDLIITRGSAGKIIDTEKTMPEIENTFADLSFTDKKIQLNTLTKEPEALDISKIHSEIKKDPKDAYYTTNPYVVYPSENGVDFKISEEEAQELINNSTENEITIPLKTLYPSVTTNMIGSEAFPDLLGTFSTKYVNNKDRTTNLILAAKKINGKVLLPGETFSYNKTVGERTIAAGYKSAAVYENGQVVQGLGGGICQISTTLFNATLFANMQIVELHNHQFVPSYVTAGRDATVVYGSKDFKFKNTRKYAIKIECTVSNGIAKFNIWGVKEPEEYDVSVYAKVTSKTASYIKSSTYRTLKLNGQVVKTENIANYTYKVH